MSVSVSASHIYLLYYMDTCILDVDASREQCHWMSVVWKNNKLKIWEEELSASVNWQQEHKFVVEFKLLGLHWNGSACEWNNNAAKCCGKQTKYYIGTHAIAAVAVAASIAIFLCLFSFRKSCFNS